MICTKFSPISTGVHACNATHNHACDATHNHLNTRTAITSQYARVSVASGHELPRGNSPAWWRMNTPRPSPTCTSHLTIPSTPFKHWYVERLALQAHCTQSFQYESHFHPHCARTHFFKTWVKTLRDWRLLLCGRELPASAVRINAQSLWLHWDIGDTFAKNQVPRDASLLQTVNLPCPFCSWTRNKSCK